MAARAMWKGSLRLGRAAVPFKLYSALEGSRALRFRLLHAPDLTPVEGRMVNPVTGDPVAPGDTRRGYATDHGEMVMLDPDELAALEPAASRDVEMLRFVPKRAVDPGWYDRPYWLGPDGDAEAYAALAAAMERRAVQGIARWVMRKRDYVGALLPERGRLMLVTLHRAGEVVDAAALPRPAGRAASAKEVEMAKQLLRALQGDLDPEEWKDEHRERVMERIMAKAEGKTIPIARYRPKKADSDLGEALERSIAALRRKSA